MSRAKKVVPIAAYAALRHPAYLIFILMSGTNVLGSNACGNRDEVEDPARLARRANSTYRNDEPACRQAGVLFAIVIRRGGRLKQSYELLDCQISLTNDRAQRASI